MPGPWLLDLRGELLGVVLRPVAEVRRCLVPPPAPAIRRDVVDDHEAEGGGVEAATDKLETVARAEPDAELATARGALGEGAEAKANDLFSP